MVAIINHGKAVRSVLLYNENKVGKGDAELILANKFLCEIDELTFANKLKRFERINKLNTRVHTNTLHISLNFDPSENISVEKMQAISVAYMDKISFGDQPFLVYQHHDAGHPHLHIVTTLVRSDGSRINTHNIGKLLSEPARKELEEQFGLVKASAKNRQRSEVGNPKLAKVHYGTEESAQAISKVVRAVIRQYRFTSLSEFNAVLSQYNITADTGTEGSYLRNMNGLQYRILNEKGERVGVPLKASRISGRPTLRSLDKIYAVNELLRKPFKDNLKEKISAVIEEHEALTLTIFLSEMRKAGVGVKLSISEEGRIFGITFIDHRTKCVFKGSDLGKEYTASGVLKHIVADVNTIPKSELLTGDTLISNRLHDTWLIDALIDEGGLVEQTPYELALKKKNKRKQKRKS